MIDTVIDVERLSASVGRYSLSLVRSKPAAEDLAQESWSRALPALREGGGHANPEALLLRVARNVWIDGLRRDARKAKLMKEAHSEEAAIDRPLLAMELAPVFAALNAFLPKLQRTVFLLRDVLGYSIKETAARLGTSEGAVKAAHVRARRSLALVQGALSREEGPGLPADENERIEAHLMADAYARGDIGTLVALANGEARMQARQMPMQGAASHAAPRNRRAAPTEAMWSAGSLSQAA
ncbi:RNA polymerase sigma-70 factor, ECF subfamily [Cohnella sp. OV330]|uniref:RNA polymerase sigma factor n=1 Tax=Cohnella sp. OV330 TaxID=1855288 RepID=UPI0008F34245|nr:RNA polymerase sigma factor [Cohnella sp. OV330]SFB44304.1 RNA polymerase sigma-70 factor, ECF subfamily [Cohnella sp. OV330]